jgi:hypothetical protein
VVAGADVYVAPEGRTSGIPLEDLDASTATWAGRTQARTDAAGLFVLETLRGSSARIVVRAPAFARHESAITIGADETDLGDIVLVDGLVLSGRVVDEHDRPIAGAELRSLPADAKPALILGHAGKDLITKSGADGAFRIDDLPAGPWLISVRAEGRPDKLERGDTRSDAVETERKIVMLEGASIRGRVLHAPEALAQSLFVRAVPTGAHAGSAVPSVAHVDEELMLATPRTARCAADGTFEVRGLNAGIAYRLAARESASDSFARVRTNRVEARAGDENVELVYDAGHTLVFQVVDAHTTAPVEEFEARFGHGFLQPLPDDGAAGAPHREGRARAELGTGLRTGDTFDLVIESIGHAPLRLADVRVPDGDIDLGVLRLEPAPSIAVTVLDAQTQKPVKGARVSLVFDGAAAVTSTANEAARKGVITDEHGLAHLNLPLGISSRLVVRHADYAASVGDEIAEPGAGETSRTVSLVRGGSVVVDVHDALGAPVRGVRVQHRGVRGDIEPPAESLVSGARTNAGGELAFSHLEVGDHLFEVDDESVASSVAGALSRAHATISEGADVRVTLRVPARARLSGRITAAGQPFQGATVRLVPRDATQSTLEDALTARTNGFGEFTLQSLPMGAYRANIAHPSRAMAYVTDLAVYEVQARFEVDIPSATITGRVVDSAGNAVVGARVRASTPLAGVAPPAEDPSSSFVTASDGTFELRGVQVDVDLFLRVEDEQHQPARSAILRVSANETRTGVDFVLADGAALEVSVFAAEGDPVRFASVLLTSGSLAREARSDGTGTARFRGLAPGTWRIAVDAPARNGVLDDQPTIELKTGIDNRVRVELR